jgi:hypothetical protein
MLSRALILATVTLLIGDFVVAPAHAQNLDAGKSPSQIFAGTCTACHKSPRGLMKSMAPGSLPGFLRQHYTTSPEMAGVLSSYLISNGATDTKYLGGQGRPDKDAKPEARPAPEQFDRWGHRIRAAAPPEPARAEPEQAAGPDARPDAEPQVEPGRKSRHNKRLAKPADDSAMPAESETAVRQPGERGPDGRKLSGKQRWSKRGKPREELPEGETGRYQPAAARQDKPGDELIKDEAAKLSAEPKTEPRSDTANTEAPKEPASQTPAMRPDPVPPVTPAAQPAAASSPEPAARSPATTADSAPVPASAAPNGAPTPPISR